MPEISIIVPVYNVERYLSRCINSILQQTFTDFELILVNDGSKDRCPQICNEWSRRDERIKVIHKKNGGLSSARNLGLECAKGNYIGFVDSDDWIEPDMYEDLYKLVKKYEADFAAVDMIVAKNEKQLCKQPKEKIQVLEKDDLFKIFFRVTEEEINYCVCDKLYKREILNGIRFWEGMRFEDIDFNFKVLESGIRGVYTNQIKYFWYYNNEGITRNVLISADLQLLQIWGNIWNVCKEKFPMYEYYARMNYERAHLGILGKSIRFGVSKEYVKWEKDKQYLIGKLRNSFFDLLFWNMPISRKLLLCIVCISPTLTTVLYRILNR